MTQNDGMLKGLVIGLLAGGAVGAIVALLYAPKSGRELRADLKERADEFREDADEYLTAARNKAGELVSDAKKRSDSLITDAKRKADTLLVDAKSVTDARQKSGSARGGNCKDEKTRQSRRDAYKEERLPFVNDPDRVQGGVVKLVARHCSDLSRSSSLSALYLYDRRPPPRQDIMTNVEKD